MPKTLSLVLIERIGKDKKRKETPLAVVLWGKKVEKRGKRGAKWNSAPPLRFPTAPRPPSFYPLTCPLAATTATAVRKKRQTPRSFKTPFADLPFAVARKIPLSALLPKIGRKKNTNELGILRRRSRRGGKIAHPHPRRLPFPPTPLQSSPNKDRKESGRVKSHSLWERHPSRSCEDSW